jgi:hypothetical protein
MRSLHRVKDDTPSLNFPLVSPVWYWLHVVQLLVLSGMPIMALKDQEKPVEAAGWGVVPAFVA